MTCKSFLQKLEEENNSSYFTRKPNPGYSLQRRVLEISGVVDDMQIFPSKI